MSESSETTGFTNYRSQFTYSSPSDILKKYKSKYNYKSAFSYSYIPLSDFEAETEEGKALRESLFSRLVRNFIVYSCYIAVLISFPISFWICLKKVHALERLVILRLGRLQPVVSPGYCLVFPFVDSYTRVDLQPKVFHIPVSQLLTADGGIVEVSAEIKYTISHVIHYVLKLQCQENTFQELCKHFLQNLISAKQQQHLQNLGNISYYMKMELNKTIVSWGLEILNIEIPSIKVLKEGEMPDAMSTVLSALKSLITNENNMPLSPLAFSVNESTGSAKVCINIDPVEKIKTMIESSSDKVSLHGLFAKCELKITDEDNNRILLIDVQDGNVSVSESNRELFDKDITIVISSSILKEILDMQTTPMDAYFGGKIQVFGNWNLLGSFANLLS